MHPQRNIYSLTSTGQLVISFTQGRKTSGITSLHGHNHYHTHNRINRNTIQFNGNRLSTHPYDSADNQFVTAKFKKSDITSIDSKAYSLELTQNTETNVGNTHTHYPIITDAGINTTDGSVVVSGIACKSKEYFYITTSNGIYKVSFELSEENEPILGNAYVVLSTVLSHNATYATTT
jgi:hypothetical protein